MLLDFFECPRAQFHTEVAHYGSLACRGGSPISRMRVLRDTDCCGPTNQRHGLVLFWAGLTRDDINADHTPTTGIPSWLGSVPDNSGFVMAVALFTSLRIFAAAATKQTVIRTSSFQVGHEDGLRHQCSVHAKHSASGYWLLGLKSLRSVRTAGISSGNSHPIAGPLLLSDIMHILRRLVDDLARLRLEVDTLVPHPAPQYCLCRRDIFCSL